MPARAAAPPVDLALVLNPRLSPVELLATVCDELRIAYPAGTSSGKELVDRLHRHLLEAHTAGRRTVLIVDEAQNLSPEVLEEVRLLTNLETAREKLLQVILIGQPELAAILEQPKLRQLAQRVTARYHLEPLSRAETRRVHSPPARRGGSGPAGLHRSAPCGRCTAGRAGFPASSTPSPIAPCWAPTRGSVPGSKPRPCGARRPRCWASLRRHGSGGRGRAAGTALVAAAGGVGARAPRAGGHRPGRGRPDEQSCRAGRARRWPDGRAGARC